MHEPGPGCADADVVSVAGQRVAVLLGLAIFVGSLIAMALACGVIVSDFGHAGAGLV